MSTLCAYENYLRDRYVLGQSVHYAAGSSSPKPKSYDREGNEYTWSDEAGDYVRQVGGPGGGRTIRLSEVERMQAEQPQNGSKAVSTVDQSRSTEASEAPKEKIVVENGMTLDQRIESQLREADRKTEQNFSVKTVYPKERKRLLPHELKRFHQNRRSKRFSDRDSRLRALFRFNNPSVSDFAERLKTSLKVEPERFSQEETDNIKKVLFNSRALQQWLYPLLNVHQHPIRAFFATNPDLGAIVPSVDVTDQDIQEWAADVKDGEIDTEGSNVHSAVKAGKRPLYRDVVADIIGMRGAEAVANFFWVFDKWSRTPEAKKLVDVFRNTVDENAPRDPVTKDDNPAPQVERPQTVQKTEAPAPEVAETPATQSPNPSPAVQESKSSVSKKTGTTKDAFPELPPLKGDLQDIVVADEIRRRIHNWAIYTNYFDNKYIPGGYYIDGNRRLYDDEVYRRFFDKKTDARFWIDNEKDILDVLKKELDSGLAELVNEGWKPSPEQAELTSHRYIEGEKYRDTARDDPNKYRSRSSAQFNTASNIRKYANKSLSVRNYDEAAQIAKKLSSLAYFSATQGDEESTKICKDIVDDLARKFGGDDSGWFAGRQRVTDNHYQRAINNAAKKRAKEEREAKRRAKEEQKAGGDAPKKKRGKKASNVPTAQEVVESETATLERSPFDSAGLGLPGSQDSVLDAKEGDNRDAAYFIRRDLGEERSQDSATEAYNAPGATEQNEAEGVAPEVSAFIDSYNKYRAETKKIASLKRKAEKVQKTVREPSARTTKEDIEARRQELVRIREEIKEAEVAKAELSKGLNEFSQKNSAVFIDDDTFIVAPSRETVVALRNRKGVADRLKELEKLAKRGKKKANGQPTVPPGLQKQIENLEDKLNEANDRVLELLKRETVVSARSNGETSRVLTPEPKNIVERETKVSRRKNVETPVAQDTPTATLEPTPQKQPAKPRPKRWTPLKSAMNDDDRRVVESTRQRLNFGLGDFAWRLANAKEKKDWAKAKELTVLAAKRYLEQARRAYRSHGGAEALAAFDESLSGDGLTVGQVRDRIVDKFRKIASMKIEDLHKYAGERLDAYDKFNKASDASTNTRALALNNLLDAQHRAPNAVPHTPPEKVGKIYEVPVDSLNLDPSRFQFKLNANSRGVTDDLEGAEFDPMQAGIIHVWRDPDDGKDYVVNGHHRFNLAKNSGYDGKVNVRYINADTADDAKAFGAVANIADSKGTATDVAEFIRTRGSDDIRTPGGKKIATKNKLLADGRVLSKLDETIFRKLKNGSIDEKTARVIAAELPDDKDKQLRLFADIERLGLDASQAQDRAWAYASIQGEKQQGSLFGDDAPMEYDIESRSKLIGEIKKALAGAKNAARAGGSSRNNKYWNKQGLTTGFDRDRASQLSKSAGETLQFFKDKIRLTGPMQNVIKEETDAYRKALKEGKDASQIVERAIERIKDVSQGGDGALRRMEGVGLEPEDRLPSVESEQAGQSVGKKKEGGEKRGSSGSSSETVRDERTTGEVLETGGTDRPSDGGGGRNLASIIAEEAKKSDIPESRVREELSSPTDKGSEKTSSSSAISPEGMSDWERELEILREFNLLEDPDATQVRKRGSGANAAFSSSPQTLTDGGASTSSFVHTPTIQQRIDAYIAKQRAQGRKVEGLTAEDYARIFPDEDKNATGEQTIVPRKKRGRPRIIRPDADNTKKAPRNKRKS